MCYYLYSLVVIIPAPLIPTFFPKNYKKIIMMHHSIQFYVSIYSRVGLSISVAVGITLVIAVPVTAIITAIITIIIMYLLCIKHNKQSEVPPSDCDTQISSSLGVAIEINTAYGQVDSITPTQNRPHANYI